MTVSSSSSVQARALPSQAPGAWWRKRDGYLFNPALDFLCLGGGSLLILVPLSFMSADTFRPAVALIFMLLANVINHPHFAHSYQIFYRNFGEKAFGETYSPALRARYVIAGIVAPLALVIFFLVAVGAKDARLLGYGGNLMVFLTGWHYVKQGYGMVIVDSVLKRNFFAERDKKILLVNSYLCWAFHWFLFNRIISEHNLWGLKYYSYATPTPLLVAVGAVAGAGSLAALWVLARKWRAGGPFPLNGAVAYLVTLYIWLLIGRFAPLMLLAVPAFHSLQYLIVVWRYQLNIENDRAGQAADEAVAPSHGAVSRALRKPAVRVVLFVVSGTLLGVAGFWLLPFALDLSVAYDKAVFGSTMFVFMFWIFINVHHYFLDNVMWRRENPDMGKYLFATR